MTGTNGLIRNVLQYQVDLKKCGVCGALLRTSKQSKNEMKNGDKSVTCKYYNIGWNIGDRLSFRPCSHLPFIAPFLVSVSFIF